VETRVINMTDSPTEKPPSSVPPPDKRPCIYWKMSIDLSRALVPSMGQHDPLDGFVTYVQPRTRGGTWAATPTQLLEVLLDEPIERRLARASRLVDLI
jgi:hypothetical protein